MPKILCVDDDASIRTAYPVLFRRTAEVITTGNGQDALDLFKARSYDYDFILTDYNMPKMDGLEFLASIRGYAYPPRLLLSRVANSQLYERARAVGATGVLYKPVSSDVLVQIAEELLTRKESETLEKQMNENFFR